MKTLPFLKNIKNKTEFSKGKGKKGDRSDTYMSCPELEGSSLSISDSINWLMIKQEIYLSNQLSFCFYKKYI